METEFPFRASSMDFCISAKVPAINRRYDFFYWVREYKVNGVLGPRSQSSFYARGSKKPRGAPGHSCLHFRAFAAETLLALDPRTRDGLAIPYQPRNFIRSRIPCGIVFVGASVAGRTPGVRAAGRAGAR